MIDAANRIGVTSISRNRSRYSACVCASKPGAMIAMVAGARKNSRTQPTVITPTASVSTVWANGRGVAGRVAAERREHRHERRGEPGRDQDVEQQLRQHERRVVRVELGAGAVGAGEDPVADEAREIRTEGQDGEQDRALGQEPREQGPTPVDHHVLPRPGAWSRTGL